MPEKKVRIPKQLIIVIDDYLATLKKDKLPVEHVYLFGSYAKGHPHPMSDVDLCIVSPKFSDYIQSIQYLLSKRQLNLKYPIEPIGIHPSQLTQPSTLTKEILRTGIQII